MKRTIATTVVALALVCVSGCAEKPQRVGDTFFDGQLRLTGELANVEEGFIFVIGRERGQRAPLLVRRYDLRDQRVRREGSDKLLDWELAASDFMGGFRPQLPPEMELKIEFDVDGDAMTKDGNEALVLAVQPGLRSYSAELRRGMPVPDEPPSSLDSLMQPDTAAADDADGLPQEAGGQ